LISGTVRYECKAEGLESRPFDYMPASPSVVTKVEITLDEKKGAILVVYVSNAPDVPAALKSADEMAAYVAERLAYRLVLAGNSVVSIGQPYQTHYSLGGQLRTSIPMRVVGSHLVADPEIQQIQGWLAQTNPAGEEYHAAFRTALDTPDPAARFMGLYHLLMVLSHDNQKEVDRFIKQEEGKKNFANTRPVPGQPGKFREESKYSRLRNEFAHNRRTGTVAKTRSEMEDSLPDLVKVTRAAIEKLRLTAPTPRSLSLWQRIKRCFGR
jgi:hypothetical protein